MSGNVCADHFDCFIHRIFIVSNIIFCFIGLKSDYFTVKCFVSIARLCLQPLLMPEAFGFNFILSVSIRDYFFIAA